MRDALQFHEAAERDLSAAANYYKSLGAGFAAAFAAAVEQSLALIREHPGAGRQAVLSVRVVVMRGFPYSVVYKLRESETLVLAVAHQLRRPGYWMGRSD